MLSSACLHKHRDASSLRRCLISRSDFVANGFVEPPHQWKGHTFIFAAPEGFALNGLQFDLTSKIEIGETGRAKVPNGFRIPV